MFTWLMANLGTVLVAAIVIAAVVLIVVSMIRKRKKGGSSCACGCENCRYAGSCRAEKP
ncbi:MAG: FeoB-associated Cys-rich membrane protein [Clostridia bacterium]|nr:FeoB-associated Cys-rich membrane protein [Clostridia bacterium]